jgi:hypothetical protein
MLELIWHNKVLANPGQLGDSQISGTKGSSKRAKRNLRTEINGILHDISSTDEN